MAVQMEKDVFAEMDEQIEAAKAKGTSSGSNVFFFKLKDGQRAMIRFLFDLRGPVKVWKHEYYNHVSKTWEMSSICAKSLDGTEEDCQHCQTAKVKMASASTKEERREAGKMEAVCFWVYPVFVYGIKNPVKDDRGRPVKDAQGRPQYEALTYKDKDENVHLVQGVRFLQVKATSPILTSLRENYSMLPEGASFLDRDIVISLVNTNGDILKPVYTVMVQSPATFNPPDGFGVEILDQRHEDIFEKLTEAWKPVLIDRPGAEFDPFSDTPPAQQQAAKSANSAPNLDF